MKWRENNVRLEITKREICTKNHSTRDQSSPEFGRSWEIKWCGRWVGARGPRWTGTRTPAERGSQGWSVEWQAPGWRRSVRRFSDHWYWWGKRVLLTSAELSGQQVLSIKQAAACHIQDDDSRQQSWYNDIMHTYWRTLWRIPETYKTIRARYLRVDQDLFKLVFNKNDV